MNNQQQSEEVKPVIVDEEGLCPTCGYFAGSLLTCPRCGARVEKRISVKFVKIASIIGSILGVILLWYAAHLKQPKQIHIEDIDERMSGAYIKVVGKVVSYVEDTTKNSLKIKLDDGTGQINIYGFNKLAQFKKIHKDNLPELGDLVEIAGTVSESQKFGTTLFMPVPERFKVLQKLQIKEYTLADIKSDLIGEIVKIKVFISSYEQRTTKKGTILHSFVLSDETGSINMVLFDSAMTKISTETKNLLSEKNAELEMLVKISEYRDTLQANLFDYTKIKKVGTVDIKAVQDKLWTQKIKQTKTIKFNKLTKKDINSSYFFSGTIRDIRAIRKGMVVTIDDGSDELSVVVWDTLKDKIKGFSHLEEDAKISGIFQIGEYKNELQLKIVQAEDVKIEAGESGGSQLEIIQDSGEEKRIPRAKKQKSKKDEEKMETKEDEIQIIQE
ncbi:MAG: OB-fold nucleic acid binding domain-containing protein [Elusimicrobiota bacterium]